MLICQLALELTELHLHCFDLLPLSILCSLLLQLLFDLFQFYCLSVELLFFFFVYLALEGEHLLL